MIPNLAAVVDRCQAVSTARRAGSIRVDARRGSQLALRIGSTSAMAMLRQLSLRVFSVIAEMVVMIPK
jgi:hypothetical protein